MAAESSAYENLLIESHGGADWVTFNRPDKLNAFNLIMLEEMHDYFGRLASSSSTRVVIIRGAGRGFCAGIDLGDLTGRGGQLSNPDEMVTLSHVLKRMRSCPQPIIALVHGPACGGGMLLALAADIRIAGKSARFNDPLIRMGLSGCEHGMSYLLPRAVGRAVAAELMYTGNFIEAERALLVGLVSQVVDDDALEATAEPLVAQMLRGSPTALAETKSCFERCADMDDMANVMAIELETQKRCSAAPEYKETLQAYVEKREPNFNR